MVKPGACGVTEETKTAKARGRPRLPEEERKGAHIKIRTRGGTRERLEAAAARHGRSVSEEVERRLEESFVREGTESDATRFEIEAAYSEVQKMMEAAAGGPVFLSLGQAIAGAVKDAFELMEDEGFTDAEKDFLGDDFKRERVVQAAETALREALDKLRAAGEILDDRNLGKVSKILSENFRERAEKALAAGSLRESD